MGHNKLRAKELLRQFKHPEIKKDLPLAKLEGRDKISPHKIANKVNEIIDLLQGNIDYDPLKGGLENNASQKDSIAMEIKKS